MYASLLMGGPADTPSCLPIRDTPSWAMNLQQRLRCGKPFGIRMARVSHDGRKTFVAYAF